MRWFQHADITLKRRIVSMESILRNFPTAQLIVDAIDSFPMGLGVNNAAHPDLPMLLSLDGHMIDLRVIYLERNLTVCVA